MKVDNINNISNNQLVKEPSNNNDKNNTSNNNIDSFKVYVRIRPYLQKEPIVPQKSSYGINHQIAPNLSKTITSKNPPKNLEKVQMLKVEKNIIYLEDIKKDKNKNNRRFIFDNVFNESTKNETVFNESIKSMIDKVLLGYNSTALAYGVTGTGKTYTIFGDLSNNFKDEGIIFKACDYLFEKIALNNNNDISYNIKVSYIEIYNEIVKDLINENSTSLMIVEDAQKGVICPNAKEIIINDSVELKKIINESNKRRTMASTNQNQFSSRSHAILQMILEKKIKKSEDNYELCFSKFLVVDLAGSERGGERGKRREEGANINKSLFTLGNCLNILSEKSNMGKFVPYRDSKLTRLLKDSLGGNILTVMLACISPWLSAYDETLSTLNYAYKAKKITKKVMKNIQEININKLQYKEIIDTLKNEIMQLKKIIKNQEIKLKEKIDIDKKDINEDNVDSNENKSIKDNYEIRTTESHGNMEILGIKNILDNNTRDATPLDNKEHSLPKTERNISIFHENEIKDNSIISKINNNGVNIEAYNKYIEDLINNDLNIDSINEQVEHIKKDKNLLETYFAKNSTKDDNLVSKYNSIKIIYEKFIEIINEKLVENIEQNMIYNFNIKEITELNKQNNDKVKDLEKQKLEDDDVKIIEEINYTNKNIMENNTQKEQIYESIKKNNEQKEELKKILINLMENRTDSMNKYIHILQEKDKLFKITKQYEKEIENYIKMQKQKDEDMVKINRKIEILRAKLKEKDRKINELEKKGGRKIDVNNIKTSNTNYYLDKSKSNTNSIVQTESQIFLDKNKSPIKSSKHRMTFKRENSKIKSPINNKDKSNKKKSNDVADDKSINNKNKFNHNNSRKRLTVIPNENNNKISKKYTQNNIQKYRTENNNENINNNNYISEPFEQIKYKELIVPKTTITLTENNTKLEQMNPLYIKNNKERILKKTPTNNMNYFKKYTSINKQNSQRHSNSIRGPNVNYRNQKKNSLKSVKVDLKPKNYSEINLNQNNGNGGIKRDKSDNDKSNHNSNNNNLNINSNSDNNLISVKAFKAEKVNIDLTNIDKDNYKEKERDKDNISLNEKINNIKLLKLKDKMKSSNRDNDKRAKSKKKNYTIVANTNTNSNNNNRHIKKMSKSNPKISKEQNSNNNNNQIKKLTLQEARYENKLKYEKVSNGKTELLYAESFLNEYKKMKSNDSLKIKQYIKNMNNSRTMDVNNKPDENESKSYFIDIQKIKINDLCNKDNNYLLEEKKKNGQDRNVNMINIMDKPNIVNCDLYINIDENKDDIEKNNKNKEKYNYEERKM